MLDELRKIITRVTHDRDQEINMETQLKDIKADSLHWVQIVVGLEDARDIEIDMEKMRDFTTIGDFVNYLESLTK